MPPQRAAAAPDVRPTDAARPSGNSPTPAPPTGAPSTGTPSARVGPADTRPAAAGAGSIGAAAALPGGGIGSGGAVEPGRAPEAAAAVPPGSPAAPRLNLDLPPGRRSLDYGSANRGVLPWVPPPPERKSKLGEAIEQSARPDCRTVYQEQGLAAVVPLVNDSANSKGCRW